MIKNNSLYKQLKNVRPEIWLILILVFALSLRLYFFIGIGITDDLKYVWSAYLLSSGQWDKYPMKVIDPLRSMMVLPLALVFSIFGVSMHSAAIPPLFFSLGNIVLTYLIGKLIFNKNVGLLAAFFLSIIPLDVVYSTQLIPSHPVTFFMLSSIYLFLRANECNQKEKLLKFNKCNVLLLLSGIFWGVAYLANELAFLLPLAFLAFMISNLRAKTNYFLVPLGFLIVFSLELLFFYIVAHDPFWRLKVIHETESTVGTNLDPYYYPRILTKVTNPDFWAQEGKLGFFFYLTCFSSVFLLLRRDKKSYFLILWVLFLLLYLQFGVMTINFRPIAKWARYLIIILPPSVLIVSRFLNIFKKLSLPVILLIILTTPYYLINVVEVHNTRVADFKNIYNYLKTTENKTIYADFGSLPYLDFYFGYKRKIIALETVSNVTEIKDSFVVINGSSMVATDINIRSKLPEFMLNPPKKWKLIKVIEGPKIGIFETFDPKIYYVPNKDVMEKR
jgi:4-amino-4-deoxy-L-arabinose transferase-like glycosyltransferase